MKREEKQLKTTEKQRTGAKLDQQWRHEHHLCVRCKGQDAFTLAGRYLCADCTEKKRTYRSEYYAKNRKALITDAIQRKQERNREGLCSKCGAPLDRDGRWCANCCKSERVRKQKKRGPQRGTDGRCFFCNRPAIDGKRVCEVCLPRCQELAERNRPKHQSEDHIWNKSNHRFVFINSGKYLQQNGK